MMDSPSTKSRFWELHRQLAECYEADLAAYEDRKADGLFLQPPPLRGQSQCSSLLSQPPPPEKRPSVLSARSQNPGAGAVSGPRRREKSLKTLLHIQGQSSAQSAAVEPSDDIELKPHECWTSSKKRPTGPMVRQKLSEERNPAKSRREMVVTTASEVLTARGPLRRCVLHPGGSWRTFWNLLVAMCIFYDLLVIPMNAFNLPMSMFLTVVGWYIQLFWNVDFVLSFFTGFYDEGTLVLGLSRIACHYAKTWMLFDLSLIVMDWSFVVVDSLDSEEAQSLQWSRSLRMLRFLRLVRMLRWIKLRRVHEVFQEYFHSQAASLYYGLASSIAHLMVLNHLIACAWFGVSRITDNNWVIDSQIEGEAIGYQYLICLNWAFAQLGVGSSSAKPANSLEYAFCILITFRSLMTSSTLISTVSNLMAGLSKIKEDENTEFRLLRCYLSQNDVPPELGQKVTQFLQHQYTLRQEARSADMSVPVLDLLSHQLRGELQFARHRKSLSRLVLIDTMMEVDDLQILHVLHRLAMTALTNASVASKDMIFFHGARATQAYLKLSGSLTYFSDDSIESLDDSLWIAEVCLWTPWVYLGDLMAEDVSRLTVLDAEQFCEIMAQNWQTHRAAAKYAQEFLANASKSDQSGWTDLLHRGEKLAPSGSIVAFTADLPRQCCPRFVRKSGAQKVQKVSPSVQMASDGFHDLR